MSLFRSSLTVPRCLAGALLLIGAAAQAPRLFAAAAAVPAVSKTPPPPSVVQFDRDIRPILQQHCYDCHGDGAKKSGVAFDELTSEEHLLRNPEFWLKVLRNTRSQIMPPPENARPTKEQQRALESWIITRAFGLDPARPDPGRVTVRRLNRTEYRNSIRDLLGIDFDADAALPPDDVGYGFDNIGDVLSISPMRMEKFIEAALAAVDQGAPKDFVVIPSQMNLPTEFVSADGAVNSDKLSFYKANKVSRRYQAKVSGEYRIHISSKVDGDATRDPQLVRVAALSDGKEFFTQDYHWSDAEYYNDERVVYWEQGEHELSFTTQPLLDLQPLRSKMDFKILFVRLEGPLDRKGWVQPPGYRRIYSRDVPPTDAKERRAYAREALTRFVTKAFRRPAADDTVDRLVALAEKTYSIAGNSFEKGIAQALVAVLSSPRFLFQLETVEPLARGEIYPRIDEYTLASRLSFAIWASTPDDELLQLASRGELRKNFRAQVQRLLADPRGAALAENFSGQWLQSRGVLETPINSADVMALEGPPPTAAPAAPVAAAAPAPAANVEAAAAPLAAAVAAAVNQPAGAVAAVTPAGAPARPARGPGGAGGRGRGGPAAPTGKVLTPELRASMKRETEAYFAHIVRNDRSVLELIDSNYTFVNDQLAAVYGLPNITGTELRQVTLPAGDLRGGVITMGSVLTVTSNPTRTSPVKRGKWILENILGAPPAPPPPNIPALEDAKVKDSAKTLSQRELLALHRSDALCASCHSRMDPLGLALENFNAFGRQRTQDSGHPIEPSGELATGEKFKDVRELKRALVDNHRLEFYRTLTEKLMTYTLGRGTEYYDVATVDRIVDALERDQGRFSTLLYGVLESAAFQQRRPTANAASSEPKPASLTLAN